MVTEGMVVSEGPTGEGGPTGMRGPTGMGGPTAVCGLTGEGMTAGWIGPIATEAEVAPEGVEVTSAVAVFTTSIVEVDSESPSQVQSLLNHLFGLRFPVVWSLKKPLGLPVLSTNMTLYSFLPALPTQKGRSTPHMSSFSSL